MRRKVLSAILSVTLERHFRAFLQMKPLGKRVAFFDLEYSASYAFVRRNIALNSDP